MFAENREPALYLPSGFPLESPGDKVFRLPEAICRRAERFFGEALAGVPIHIGPAPALLGCEALASASGLHFAPGKYAPDTPAGLGLLFHELTHVVQQRRGAVTQPPGGGAVLVHDARLEAEADRMAGLARVCEVGPLASGPRGRREPGGGAKMLQPVVTVRVDGADREFSKSGGAGRNAAGLLALLSERFHFGLPGPTLERFRTKIRHWVDAPRRAMLSGKGHDKRFGCLEDLVTAVLGRISDADSKALEGRLAQRVQNSGVIHFLVRQFITRALAREHRGWLEVGERHRRLRADGAGASRYSYFYSKGISAVMKCAQRSLDEGLVYIIQNDPATTVMAAFLADYALKVREWFAADYPPIPHEDARLNHFNVNEQSEWVQRARREHVRLGAGPSATTMQVLRMARWVMRDWSEEQANRTMLCIALALFAFWNLEKSKLQMFSEIHTYHEVMLVAYSFGLPFVPSLGGRPAGQAEFEYPREEDIPT